MKWFILVTVLALLAFALLAGLMLSGAFAGVVPVQRVGVGLDVDARWITVDAYYSERDRGTAVRNLAWVDGDPSRGAPVVHTVRLATVPNVFGRARLVLVAARTTGGAVCAVARYLLTPDPANGGHDVDRR